MARRLPIFVVFPILLVLILSAAWSTVDHSSFSLGPSVLRDVFSTAFPPQQLGASIDDMTRDEYVNASAPFASFREALVPGANYITIGLGAGLANQIIAVFNLLLVSRLSQRIPILPDFTRDYGHIPPSDKEKPQTGSHNLPVSELFDMERYTRDTDYPTLTWADLKIPGAKTERASCWESHDEFDRIVPASLLTYNQATEGDIEVDIWSSPSSIREIHHIKDLVAFLGDWPKRKAHAEDLLSRWRSGEIGVQEPGWEPKMQEDQFVCWSEMYYPFINSFDERWETTWEAWRTVGRHLHFAKPLLDIVAGYRTRVLGEASEQYIAVHARHGDFGRGTPASTYLPHVQTLQQRHPELKKVLVFSDETEESWWEGVTEQGWSRVDHDGLKTVEELGAWYPTLIDMVLLSESSALIGTQASTFSLLAKLRVQEWTGGDTIIV